MRSVIVLVLCAFPMLTAARGAAQEWAEKMFSTTSHDFGSIARGSKAVFSFQVKNLYEETVHIAGVRSSCGCTTPKISQPLLKTFDSGEIVAEFNTVAFRGPHSATLTVVIDQPFPAEVRLQVHGNVRGDVVFQPGAVMLGSVDQGTDRAQQVSVLYAGRDDWEIVDVRSANPHFEVDVTPTQRERGRVAYQLSVRLKPTAPVGYVNGQLVLVTNDPADSRIPLEVEGRVVPEISISPRALVLGDVPVGTTVTKKLVVSGKRPFRIVDVLCGDGSFSFDVDDDQRTLHLVAVAYTPGDALGKVEQTIRIRTDRGEEELQLSAHATVLPGEAQSR